MKYNFNSEDLVNLDEQLKILNCKIRIYVNKNKLRTVTFRLDKEAIGCSQNYNLIAALEDAAENIMEETLSFDKFYGEKGETVPDCNIDQLLLDGYKIDIKPFSKKIGTLSYPFIKAVISKKKESQIFSVTSENIEETLNELEDVAQILNHHGPLQKTLMNYKIRRNTKYKS